MDEPVINITHGDSNNIDFEATHWTGELGQCVGIDCMFISDITGRSLGAVMLGAIKIPFELSETNYFGEICDSYDIARDPEPGYTQGELNRMEKCIRWIIWSVAAQCERLSELQDRVEMMEVLGEFDEGIFLAFKVAIEDVVPGDIWDDFTRQNISTDLLDCLDESGVEFLKYLCPKEFES